MSDTAAFSETFWVCEGCTARGAVQHTKDAGVYEVVELLRKEHNTKGTQCRFDLARTRVSKTPLKFNVAKNQWEATE